MAMEKIKEFYFELYLRKRILILILIFLIVYVLFFYWSFLYYESIDALSAQNTLNSLIQALGALLGLVFVGYAIINERQEKAMDYLRGLRIKYYTILLKLGEKQRNPKVAIVEKIRRKLVRRFKRNKKMLLDRATMEEVGGDYNNKELLADVSVLSNVISNYFFQRSYADKIEKDLLALGYSEDVALEKAYVDEPAISQSPSDFFELLDKVNFTNKTLLKIPEGEKLVEGVWDNWLHDGVWERLDAISKAKKFKSNFLLPLILLMGILTIFCIFLSSSISQANFDGFLKISFFGITFLLIFSFFWLTLGLEEIT